MPGRHRHPVRRNQKARNGKNAARKGQIQLNFNFSLVDQQQRTSYLLCRNSQVHSPPVAQVQEETHQEDQVEIASCFRLLCPYSGQYLNIEVFLLLSALFVLVRRPQKRLKTSSTRLFRVSRQWSVIPERRSPSP